MIRSRPGRATSLSLSIVAIVVAAGCTHSNAGAGSSDGGSEEGGVCAEDSGCEGDDGGVDAFAVDTGWVCPVIPESNAGADCDTCVQTHCDAPWCTCAQDTGTSDGGVSACLAYLSCAVSCPPDAGDAGACGGCMPGSLGLAQAQAMQLVNCIDESCATQCPVGTDLFL